MKFQAFIAAVVILAIGACKPSYKATDKPKTTTDTTSAAVNMPPSTDSANIAKMDSARQTDSINQILPDSAKISKTDSLPLPGIDSAVSKAELDPDSVKITPSVDTVAKTTQAPPIIEATFTKQYPGATNVVWSAYDSLAAVPIDLRLTGWNKMDAEDHMVKFDFKDKTYYAWYDSKGKWIGSAYTVDDFTKLPAAVNTAVKNAIKTRYSGYNISQVNREMQAGNKSAYEVELIKDDNKVRMLVTPAGKITQIYKYSAEKPK